MTADFPTADPTALLRRRVYALFIMLTAGIVAGRILSVQQQGPLPTHGDNDRSRWVTIRALVDQGTYTIGYRREFPTIGNVSPMIVHGLTLGRLLHFANPFGAAGPPPPMPTFQDVGLMTESGWSTIDKVLDPEKKEFYSSKPPLLPTILAGEYWLLQRMFGWTLKENPWEVVRTILFTVNWLPFVIYLFLLARVADRWMTSDWGRFFVVIAGCMGTLMNPFLTTLNNHTIAACSAMFALYPFIRIWYDECDDRRLFACAGFFASWTACTELPAASLAAVLGGLLLLRFPKKTLLCFVPAALIPIAAFEATNYWATGHWQPIYEKFGTIWYEYAGSFWANKKGIDAAAEPKTVYAFHLFLGHHGVFSLTPIFVLSFLGMLWSLLPNAKEQERKPLFGFLSLAVSVVVLGFYVYQTNNYGGWTAGARWFLWLIPLWLLTMQPMVDGMAKVPIWRGVGYFLLGFSALSSSYPAFTPWRHPWLYNFLEYLGLVYYP